VAPDHTHDTVAQVYQAAALTETAAEEINHGTCGARIGADSRPAGSQVAAVLPGRFLP
jgi:hypothetical protein